jgi:predicted transglutaminase-like cysteine proteinase
VSPPAGDCNDYAVTKCHQPLTRGWPSRALCCQWSLSALASITLCSSCAKEGP